MKRMFGDAEHLVRVLGLMVAGLLVFLTLQAVLVPEGFGAFGHYRAGALEDNRQRPVVHAGRTACTDCHGDPGKLLAAGPHARIGCESCHGAQGAHARSPETGTPARPDAEPLCLRCHLANVARPAAFPQMQPKDHAPEGTCLDCHQAHHPKLAPGEAP